MLEAASYSHFQSHLSTDVTIVKTLSSLVNLHRYRRTNSASRVNPAAGSSTRSFFLWSQEFVGCYLPVKMVVFNSYVSHYQMVL